MGPIEKAKHLQKRAKSIDSYEFSMSACRSEKLLRTISRNPNLKKIYRLLDKWK